MLLSRDARLTMVTNHSRIDRHHMVNGLHGSNFGAHVGSVDRDERGRIVSFVDADPHYVGGVHAEREERTWR
jgi:hypothetical protein